MWLGQRKNNQDSPFGLKWPKEPILSLGVFFSYSQTDADELISVPTIRDFGKSFGTVNLRILNGKI